jgi:hypothetical protein
VYTLEPPHREAVNEARGGSPHCELDPRKPGSRPRQTRAAILAQAPTSGGSKFLRPQQPSSGESSVSESVGLAKASLGHYCGALFDQSDWGTQSKAAEPRGVLYSSRRSLLPYMTCRHQRAIVGFGIKYATYEATVTNLLLDRRQRFLCMRGQKLDSCFEKSGYWSRGPKPPLSVRGAA